MITYAYMYTHELNLISIELPYFTKLFNKVFQTYFSIIAMKTIRKESELSNAKPTKVCSQGKSISVLVIHSMRTFYYEIKI